jgi:hypothetical protein
VEQVKDNVTIQIIERVFSDEEEVERQERKRIALEQEQRQVKIMNPISKIIQKSPAPVPGIFYHMYVYIICTGELSWGIDDKHSRHDICMRNGSHI